MNLAIRQVVVTLLIPGTDVDRQWPGRPSGYGRWQTAYERHRRWSADGTWTKILQELQVEADATDPDGAWHVMRHEIALAGADSVALWD